jgi:hypothetical protein
MKDVVLAGSYPQFNAFVQNTGRQRREFLHATRVDQLKGLAGFKLWRTGTWADLPGELISEAERRAKA